MAEELKPIKCGCGGEAKVEYWVGRWYVRCQNVNCLISTKNCDTEAEAITAWNKAMGERTAKVFIDLNCVDGIAYQQHICSACDKSLNIPLIGKSPDWKPKYCQNCGARLEWE